MNSTITMNSESEIKGEAVGQTVGTLAVKRTEKSPALALAFGILCATVWSAYFSYDYRSCERSAGTYRRHYAQCFSFCRTELALRAVAIQRFAQRTGHLPQSLSECASDLIRLDELVAAGLIFQAPKHSVTNRPSATLDFLGLPIIYQRGGQAGNDGSWFRSSDLLPREVEEYLEGHGGQLPDSPEPFALSNLFLRDRLAHLRRLEWEATRSLCWLLGGLVFIAIGTVVLAEKWRRFGPSAAGETALTGSVVVAVLTGFWGLMSEASCYMSSSFKTSDISLEERLRLIDGAVKRGEVSEQVAQTARGYLQKLWGSAKLPQARGGGSLKQP